MSSGLTLALTLLQSLFAKNTTVQELVPIIEQIGAAITNEKNGQAWTITFPETEGKPGTMTVGWAPTA